jgi:probable rRNA maturation factor
MIYIKNTQRSLTINVESITSDLERILAFLGYADFAVSVWFTTEKTIQRYNAQFRTTNKATDVLSFPYHADLKPGDRIVIDNEDDKNVGDILIAPTYVERQLADFHQTFDERIRVLLVHSVCHLLGYDHISDADYEIMHKEENRILHMLKKKG